MILPNFDEKEYMNQLEEDEDSADAILAPVNEIAQLTKEAKKTTTEEAREDAAQDPTIEL